MRAELQVAIAVEVLVEVLMPAVVALLWGQCHMWALGLGTTSRIHHTGMLAWVQGEQP